MDKLGIEIADLEKTNRAKADREKTNGTDKPSTSIAN